MVTKHEGKHGVHTEADELVYRDVYKMQVKHCEQTFAGLDKKIDEVKDTLKEEFAEVKELIKDNHKS